MSGGPGESSAAAGPGGEDAPRPGERLLDPETERLFELGSASWTARIKAAHERPGLGRLGPYELLEEVGRGGQGEVYRAVQPGTGRVVALKRVAGLGLAPDPALLARFTREVEALTRLSHPNVVSVYALEVIDGHSLLVMEFVQGRPIDRWADGVWAAKGVGAGGSDDEALKAVLTAFAGVCEGIGHAHQRGVLHRDIKPSNILVAAEDRPKVLDFGIARVLGEQAAADASPAWTVTGFAGTPAYASPEQLRPGPGGIDTRSDVYSLGVLLFRILTGEEAVDPRGGLAALIAVAGQGPVRPPTRVRAGLPGECDWIVRKATDPDPDRRYQGVDALAEDVRRLMDGRAVLAHPPSAWYVVRRAVGRRPWTSGLIAGAALVIAALGITAAVQAVRLSIRSSDLAAALVEANAQRVRAEQGERRQELLRERMLYATMGAARESTFAKSTDTGLIETLYGLVDQLTPEDDEGMIVDLHMRLGFALVPARRYAEAEAQLAIAQSVSERIDEPWGERATRIASRRAFALRGMGRLEDSLACITAAMARAAAGPPTIYAASMGYDHIYTMRAMQKPTEELLAAAAEFVRACDLHPERVFERARSREEATTVALGLGLYEQAEVWGREALELGSGGNVDSVILSRIRHRYASALIGQNKWADAEPLMRAASDFRLRYESAAAERCHNFLRIHAEVLHRLKRFDEAAKRWQLSLVRPTSGMAPDERLTAMLRLRLAAASLGAGEVDAGRVALAGALSLGRTSRPDDPEIREMLARVEEALGESGWLVDGGVEAVLGESGWMVGDARVYRMQEGADGGGE